MVLSHIKGSFLHGAAFYDSNRIVLALTVRGKDADKFWFSLFHEFGHIVLGHITQSHLDYYCEAKADAYASESLIPQDKYSQFVERRKFDESEITYFSGIVGVSPGIVLVRLQKDNHVPYSWHNNLKVQYEIVTK